MERRKMNATITDLRKILLSGVIFLALNKDACGQDCLFTTDLCNWSNEGDIDWVQTSVSLGTGTAHFAEVPVSDRTAPGPHQATLTSMSQTHVMTMLGFYYRLGAPNTLTVVADLDGTLVEIWSRNGTDGGSWVEVDVPVPQTNRFKISFRAGIPENSTTFVGLTNITLRVGEDECASSPCLNGGVCNDGNNSFTCFCTSGFRGERCQIDTNAPPKTTTLSTTPTTQSTTVSTTLRPTTQSTTISTTFKPTSPAKTVPLKTSVNKTPPSTEPTVKYGTVSTPAKLPQTGGDEGLKSPAMIAVIAVASIVVIAVIITIVWLLVYFKKRSWRPRYHERGVSMENVSNADSIHGKWTSTVDIPGSIPESKQGLGLTPIEENGAPPKKVENIYVTPPSVGIVNTAYNIDNMY